MAINSASRIFLSVAVATALLAAPGAAQQKGKAKDQGKANATQLRGASQDRPELRRRDDDRRVQQRPSDDWLRSSRGQAPPFCRNGQGHPVHGTRWCIDKGYGLYGDSRRNTGNVRQTNRDDRNGDWGRYSSYEDAHAAFHRQHDRQCRERAAQRPLDLEWQLRVRNECRQRHDDWHYRAGRAH